MTLDDARSEWNPVVGYSGHFGPPGACVVYSRSEYLREVEKHNGRPPHDFMNSGGACWLHRDGLPLWQRLALLMTDFQTLVVRDGLDPLVVHAEFLKIDEYRQIIARDCPGADPTPIEVAQQTRRRSVKRA